MNPVRPIQSKEIIILFLLSLFFTTNLWAVTAPFIDDMEGSDDNGWTLDPADPPGPPDTNDWERGTPTGGGAPTFTAPPPLVHPSWNKCWGTVLNGAYDKNKDSRLTSPQIDLGPSPPKPFFSVYTWYQIAAGDYVYIQDRPVGSPTWNTLETITPGSNSGGWVKKTYNLTGYTGNIEVSFRLVTDNKNQDLGLYIDDVAVGTNLDTENRYIIALEPEQTPISTSTTSNNMTVRVEVRDLFKFIDNSIDGNEVTIQTVESNSNPSLTQVTSPPVYLSGGKATFTFTDIEKETIVFTPSVTVSGQSLTSISTTGKFLSPFIRIWEEKE